MLTLALGAAAVLALLVAIEAWPSCVTRDCRRPFASRLRRLDDGQVHVLCGRCARHVDRLRANLRPVRL